MVGVAMPFAMARRMAQGASTLVLFKHVLWRAFLLVVLSNIYSNWGSRSGLKLQFINVLCQIAFGYVICFLITRMDFPQAGSDGGGDAGWILGVVRHFSRDRMARGHRPAISVR